MSFDNSYFEVSAIFKNRGVRHFFFASSTVLAPLFQARSLIENTRMLSDVFQEIVDVMLADSRISLVLCVLGGAGLK